MAEAARKSLQELGAIFIGISVTKVVVMLTSVHYNPLVEVFMETAIHVLTLTLLHVARTPSSAEGLCLAAEAFLHCNTCPTCIAIQRCVPLFRLNKKPPTKTAKWVCRTTYQGAIVCANRLLA